MNVATAALLYVIVVVLLSYRGGFASSIVVSIIAALCLAHLAPPRYSFRVNDPFDVVAIIAFLATSLIIAGLASKLHTATEEALSSVNRKLVDSEENERAKIARELHDDIGQRLALLAIKLEQLRGDSSELPAEVRNRIDEVHRETLGIATDTNPYRISCAHRSWNIWTSPPP